MTLQLAKQTEINDTFNEYIALYKHILETLYTKALQRANNKAYVKQYFIENIQSEIEFNHGKEFNASVLNYFQIYYDMGFAWKKFFHEVRILQMGFRFNEQEMDLLTFVKLNAEFSAQEINRIVFNSKLLRFGNEPKTIYDYMASTILTKHRDIDFIKFVAKYKAVTAFLEVLKKLESGCKPNENITSHVVVIQDNIRWSKAKGKKIELIRLLVSLNDSKYFETTEGLTPSQEQLMNYFGEMLSVNLQHYEQDLSNGFESKLQTNTALFDKLKSSITKRFYQKVENN
jgi:hypothetical protein